ncbi:MAG: GerMN domain-containing protein [bacterium]
MGCGEESPEKQKEKEILPRETVRIYLLNTDNYGLQPVEREVPEADNISSRIEQIFGELTTKPDSGPLVRVVPPDLKVRTVYVDGQTIYIDVNDELMGAASGSSGEMMLLYSMVNSVLANVPRKYKLVQFLVNGEMKKTIGPYGEESGHIAIQYPLGPRWNLVNDTHS